MLIKKRVLHFVIFLVLIFSHLIITAQENYSYNTNIKPITNSICGECHFDFQSYTNLINKPGFVIPGDPDNSIFVWRIEGETVSGEPITRMPDGGPYLSDETIQIVRAWITQGAPEDISTIVDTSERWLNIKKLFE
ncbi:hypothetical protein ACFL55_00405 [Candidatus Latescibacterota bacterium]